MKWNQLTWFEPSFFLAHIQKERCYKFDVCLWHDSSRTDLQIYKIYI